MRILIRIFLMAVPIVGALVMSNCGPAVHDYRSYSVGKVIQDVPLEKYPRKLETYQVGEFPKDPEFIRVRTLEVSSFEGYANLIQQLEKIAHEAKMDALIEIKKSESDENLTQTIDNQPFTSLRRKFQLSAVGIKYLKNIDYAHKYRKKQKVYANSNFIKNRSTNRHLDSSAWGNYVQSYEVLKQISPIQNDSLLAEAEFSVAGHLQKVIAYYPDSLNYYQMYVYPYSWQYLLTDTRNWRYLNDASGKLKMREKLDDFGRVVEALRFKYFSQTPHIKSIQVFNQWNGASTASPFKYQVDLKYDIKERWIEKIVYVTKSASKTVYNANIQYNITAFLKEIPVYDAQNRLIKSTIYLWQNDKWKPILYTFNEYYTYEDLKVLCAIKNP
jgi:hypothetical protein